MSEDTEKDDDDELAGDNRGSSLQLSLDLSLTRAGERELMTTLSVRKSCNVRHNKKHLRFNDALLENFGTWRVDFYRSVKLRRAFSII
jgi:hypothetical protein